jgi:hypothetical protein
MKIIAALCLFFIAVFPAAAADNISESAEFSEWTELLRKYPADDNINIGYARAAMRAKKYFNAILAYERLLAKYPDNHAFRSEMAEAYIKTGNYAEAKRELLIIYAAGDPNSSRIAELKLKELSGVRREAGKPESSLMNWEAELGGVYDSNANKGLESERLTNNVVIPDSKAVPSAALFGRGGLYGRYRFADTPYLAVWDLGGYYRYNVAEALPVSNSSMWGRAALGGRYAFGRYLAEIKGKYELNRQTNEADNVPDQEVSAYGSDLIFLYQMSAKTLITLRASAEKRSYNVNAERDGVFLSLGGFAGYAVNEILTVSGGANFYYGGAEDAFYSFIGTEALLKLAAELRKFNFSLFLAYRADFYEEPGIFWDEAARLDKILTLNFSAAYLFTPSLSLHFSYTFANDDSNSEVYRYTAHLASLSCKYRF